MLYERLRRFFGEALEHLNWREWPQPRTFEGFFDVFGRECCHPCPDVSFGPFDARDTGVREPSNGVGLHGQGPLERSKKADIERLEDVRAMWWEDHQIDG